MKIGIITVSPKLIISIVSIICSLISTISYGQNQDLHELGKATYNIACSNCHDPRLAQAIKSPAAFDAKAWRQRFQAAKAAAKNNPQRYADAWAYLVDQVKRGKGLMHHGGLCKEADVPEKNCSDAAYAAAIEYMSNPKNNPFTSDNDIINYN